MGSRSSWCAKDGNIPWSWMLLAVFSHYGSFRMDEPILDGIICMCYIWRKEVVYGLLEVAVIGELINLLASNLNIQAANIALPRSRNCSLLFGITNCKSSSTGP